MNAVAIAGLVLILLLLSVTLGKRNKLVADKYLIVFLLISAIGHGYTILEQTDWMQHSYWMLLGRGLYLVYSPVFFIYVFALTHNGKIPGWMYAVFVFPVVIFVLHFFYYYGWVFENDSLQIKDGLLYIDGTVSLSWLFFAILMLVIEPIYLVWFYFILRDYRKRLLASVSNIDRIHLDWVRILFYMRVAMAVLLTPVGFLAVGRGWISTEIMNAAIEVVSLFFFFVLGYYGFNQTTVFANVVVSNSLEKGTVRYERSGLTDEQLKLYHERLLSVIKEKKPFLNGELSARELAEMTGITTNQLSEVLSTVQRQNFFDLINSYRVEEVKQRLGNPQFSHLTLLAIALESGFNSKTSFNTIFKKTTGQTPSQYLKSPRSRQQ